MNEAREDFYRIDLDRLEEECIAQPKLMYDAIMELVEAKRDYEQAKADLQLTGSELDRDIRRNPSRFGLEKVTEDVVKQTVIWQVQYQNANKRVLETKYDMEVFGARVTALESKKKSLELAVDLWSKAYFAEPKIPREARTVMEADSKLAARRRTHAG